MTSEKITLYRTNDEQTEVIEQLPKTITSIVYDHENEQFLNETIGDITQTLDTHKTNLSDVDVSLTQIKDKLRVSVKDFGAKGDGVSDDTAAIQRAINEGSYWDGKVVYFPNGQYVISETLTIPKPLNLVGENHIATRIVQKAVDKDAVHILSGVERGLIYNLSIFGNSEEMYGDRQTSGKGIVLHNNAVCWQFDRIWLRGHTHGIYGGMLGHVNNIIINNSFIEHNRFDGVHIVHGNGTQVNNIIIRDNNFSGNGRNGLSLFGNNILVTGNTIQGNRGSGISLNCDYIEVIPSHLGYTAFSMNIKDNYFELNRKGHIYGKALYDNSTRHSKYMFGVTIEDNYGFANTGEVDAEVTGQVMFEAPTSYYANANLRHFYVKNNRFSGNINMYDFNNGLDGSSVIYTNTWDTVSGVAGATRIGPKTKLIRGALATNDAAFSSGNQYSANITQSKTIWYDLGLTTSDNLRGLSFKLFSAGDVTIKLHRRWSRTDAYEGYLTTTFKEQVLSGASYKDISHYFDTNIIQITEANVDMMLGIEIALGDAQSYVNLGNINLFI